MTKRKLPIGIQSLAEIRQGGYYYVDKTPFAWQLVDEGKYYFLSRPRRFGKSLFLDTLKALFEGNEPLFRGLFVHDKWDWQKKYPVIVLDFGGGAVRNRQELDTRILYQIRHNERRLGLPESQAGDIPGLFSDLIQNAHQIHKAPAVVLIDEYDKPILDNITDPERAIETREGLKNLYSILKSVDANLRFCLLTGVSKFSKVSLFSGLNNLNDISMDKGYSAICGYTEQDVDTVFAPELPGLDRAEIRRWYNGYNWGGDAVYNPFDSLLLFQKREFKPYWFESATPTFLVKILGGRGLFTPQLTQLHTDVDLLGHFEVDHIGTEALLFQTGYLTICGTLRPLPGVTTYILGYPNYEVEMSLNKALLPMLGMDTGKVTRTRIPLLKALSELDFDGLYAHLKALYAGIPHDWYRKNPIAQYEGYYASVFYSHFAALGLHVTVEDASSQGTVDLSIAFNGQIYLFEFKAVADQAEGRALAQIKARGYANKYRSKGQPIHLIGVEFSKSQRQIVAFEVERVEG